MQIHIFISEQAPAGDRLISALQPIMNSNPVIQYHRLATFGRMVAPASKEPIIAVIMVGENEELSLLSEIKGIWDKIKTILVLQDDDQDTINLCLSLRPIFITYMDSNFKEVTTILHHIRNRSEISNENPTLANKKRRNI